MQLDEERQVIHDELVGACAEVVDGHSPGSVAANRGPLPGSVALRVALMRFSHAGRFRRGPGQVYSVQARAGYDQAAVGARGSCYSRISRSSDDYVGKGSQSCG